jgi:hypothetical protein
MSSWKENQEKRYDVALEAQAELERINKRADRLALSLKVTGSLLLLSIAKLHLSTSAGKLAGIVGPLFLIAAWVVSRLAKSREDGPEYLSILEPEGEGVSGPTAHRNLAPR